MSKCIKSTKTRESGSFRPDYLFAPGCFALESESIRPRYDNVALIPLVLQLGLRIGPIQRMGAAPGVIHTGRFFVLIPL